MRKSISIPVMVLAAWLTAGSAYAQQIDKYDSKLPVDISADSLEVLQNENKAIFKGNVVAKQGKINLRSDRMTVYKATTAQESQANAISKIEVDGNVFMATPEESAKASKGAYHVTNKLIILEGDVVLTREKNVLKGSRLEYNLATGKSLLTGGASLEGGTSATGTGRVRGLFVPQQ